MLHPRVRLLRERAAASAAPKARQTLVGAVRTPHPILLRWASPSVRLVRLGSALFPVPLAPPLRVSFPRVPAGAVPSQDLGRRVRCGRYSPFIARLSLPLKVFHPLRLRLACYFPSSSSSPSTVYAASSHLHTLFGTTLFGACDAQGSCFPCGRFAPPWQGPFLSRSLSLSPGVLHSLSQRSVRLLSHKNGAAPLPSD